MAGQESKKKMVAFLTAVDLEDQQNELIARVEAIVETAKAEERELTAEETAEVDSITDQQLPEIKTKHDRAVKLEALTAQKLQNKLDSGDVRLPVDGKPSSDPFSNIRVPSSCFRSSSRVGFKGQESERDAYVSGLWLASITGNAWATQKIADLGISNAMSEGTDSAGGFTVPDPLANEIIRLVEMYGVFRQYTRVVPMTADTLSVPRRTAGLTVYYPAEGAGITASDMTFAQAVLTAKKYATLSLMSTELSEDSVISMAALTAQEIAYAIAVAEDTNGFTGDGTGTYASITGLSDALLAGSVKTAASGKDTVQELALTDYHAAKGAQLKVPGSRNFWFVNSDVYENSMAPLMTAAGGNTATDIANGTQPRFLGTPVVFTEVLPNAAAAAGSTVAYYGDLSLAATMGSRRDVTIKTLNELYAATDQIGIQATSRSAITVHEVGTASIGGPVTAVKLAAS